MGRLVCAPVLDFAARRRRAGFAAAAGALASSLAVFSCGRWRLAMRLPVAKTAPSTRQHHAVFSDTI